MASGVVSTVLVCVPSSTVDATGLCPSGSAPGTAPAYLLNTSQGDAWDLASQPFSAATAGEYFGFAFAATVGLWALAYGAGQVIKLVRTS